MVLFDKEARKMNGEDSFEQMELEHLDIYM